MSKCPNCGYEDDSSEVCPNCGSGASTIAGGCATGMLGIFAVLGAAAGTCGLWFAVAMISEPNRPDEIGMGVIAVCSLVIGAFVLTVSIWGIRSRRKR